ncbi:hypothetical protein RJD38_21270 (plasmid) [Vibrio scophthalmi]|uniref:hypothetical protein n=1 Tax=Vibrio scophthalmi TaxID=45658 RepID=UPI0008094E79|nr:hypothetical protein [Vibrio scophthalmi]ANS88073.1 hypothetical protein VSVS12_04374 [Vibrio scophthalmi]ANS88199.1 hypothetical protein VSVS12_04501 [Vibrio scophthalmi]
MEKDLYQELVNRNYLKLKLDNVVFTKKTQRNGSPLDRYRNEILFFRHEMKCSYQDIEKWLLAYKGVKRSKVRIFKKIKEWEKENASKKKSSTKET